MRSKERLIQVLQTVNPLAIGETLSSICHDAATGFCFDNAVNHNNWNAVNHNNWYNRWVAYGSPDLSPYIRELLSEASIYYCTAHMSTFCQ